MSDNEELISGQEAFAPEERITAENIDRRIYQKTLTIARIGAAPERAKTLKQQVLLCRIAGEVRGVAVESLPDDPDTTFTALVGEFEADVYSNDGEVTTYYGGQCYLPILQEAVLTRLQRETEMNPDNPSVRFNLQFASEPWGNPAGYRYVARNVDPIAKRVDELQKMRERANLITAHPGLPRLGAPSAPAPSGKRLPAA